MVNAAFQILLTSMMIWLTPGQAIAAESGPWSKSVCADFLTQHCADILKPMLSSLVLLSMLSLPAESLLLCDGNVHQNRDDLIQLTSVPDEEHDTRYGMHEGGPKNDLTPEEMEQLTGMIGKVLCPTTKTQAGAEANGFVIGDQADIFVTNAHVPHDGNGVAILQDMSTFIHLASTPDPEHDPRYGFHEDASKAGL